MQGIYNELIGVSMKVNEYLSQDDYQEIEDKASEGGYWANCFNFVKDIMNKDMNMLTARQRDWLDRIIDGLKE